MAGIDESQLANGITLEVTEGDHKGKRGTVLGWTDKKGKHIGKRNGDKAGTVAVLIGTNRWLRSDTSFLFSMILRDA